MIAHSFTDLIGTTPLLEFHRLEQAEGCRARILGKLEYFNPAGSVKDRIALAMIADAEATGKLLPGGTIVEPTSGNTGIGLAAVAAARGYRFIAVMPESMSLERRKLIAAYGAELVLTPASQGMKGAIAKAEELSREIVGAFSPGQFANAANPEAHRRATGPEIWQATGGEIDFFVAGVGTGGTLTGVGSYLKSHNTAIRVIGVEPTDSPVLSGGSGGPHKIQGIGAGFIPPILDMKVCDAVMTVTSEDAIETARKLARLEGILVGISSGAALSAALDIGCQEENEGKDIVVLLPDGGERYLSTELFA